MQFLDSINSLNSGAIQEAIEMQRRRFFNNNEMPSDTTFRNMILNMDKKLFHDHIIPYTRITDDGTLFFKSTRDSRTYISSIHSRWTIFDKRLSYISESAYEYIKYPNYPSYIVCSIFDFRNTASGVQLAYVIDPQKVVLQKKEINDFGNPRSGYNPVSVALSDEQYKIIMNTILSLPF